VEPGEHLDLLLDALRLEAEGHRLLLAGDAESAHAPLWEAAGRYRASWEVAPPASYGRLVGMLKAAILAGGGADEARYALDALEGAPDTPTASYARAIAATVLGDERAALAATEAMRAGSPAFGRAADALRALAQRDGDAYARAVGAIVTDFEGREEHLTGVAIADTALMMERLAEPLGLALHPRSALMPV
jgi:hypothetical protein